MLDGPTFSMWICVFPVLPIKDIWRLKYNLSGANGERIDHNCYFKRTMMRVALVSIPMYLAA